jgi:hypothetical protein
VESWARIDADGPRTTSGGTVVRFDATGLVNVARDYSTVEPGHRPRPADAF